MPSPTGKTWAFSTVANMIDNPAYAGWQVTGREEGKSRRLLYRNAAGEKVSVMIGPAVLTEKEWNAAQAASRGTGPPGGKESWKARHVLTDLLECTGCGGSMTWRGKGYSCWRPGAGGVCPAPAYVAQESAEGHVFYRWSTRLAALDPGDRLLSIVAERWKARQDPEATEGEAAARAALADAEAALSRLWKDRRAGLYDGPSESYFAPSLKEANDAVLTVRKTLDGARGQGSVDISFLLETVDQHEAWEVADDLLKRDLLRLAIRRIRVKKADYRGQAFDGLKRMEIIWHDDE
ncbi:recombinase family protein [Streptomyces sp. NPDC058751]|uniref:recombinase family protein n=1 Tax=Streptomyces sp. NPDC058751 TaxID=3346623 RepID=UPI0036CC8C18